MPKLSKNAELAQYYTYAQQNEANAPFLEGLDNLITSLEKSTEGQEYTLNLQENLLNSLNTFKQYCKYAAEDINEGIKKSPNLVAASDEAKKILDGFDLLKQRYPGRYDNCKAEFENFTENTKLLTAAQWIEKAGKDYKSGAISEYEALARIFAIRNLANAERGKRANIDKTILTASQIEGLQSKYSKSEEFSEFAEIHEEALTGILKKIGSHNHGGRMEDLFKSYALKQSDSPAWDDELFARLKPDLQKQMKFRKKNAQKEEKVRTANAWNAAKWIEKEQKRIENMDDPDLLDEPLANILAVRIVADTQPGGNANLDKKKMTRWDFAGIAENLKNSQPFLDYMSEMREKGKESFRKKTAEELAELNNLPADDPRIVEAARKEKWNVDKTLFTDDQGEKFEADFRKYLLSRPDVNELDPELYGRILKGPLNAEAGPEKAPANRKSSKEAADVRYSTFEDYFKKNKTNEDNTLSQTYHAAKMAAAADIMLTTPYVLFDRKMLEDKARTYLKDPSFCMVTRDPKVLLSMCAGDMDKFPKEVSKLNDTFENADPFNQDFRDSLDQLKKGNLRETKRIIEAAEKCNTYGGNYTKKNIALANAIIEFQDQYKDEKTGPLAEAVNESMKMLADFVGGSDAEIYLRQQLDKVNKARGLKPGDSDYLSQDDVLPQKQVEEPEVDPKEKDDAELKPQFI